jgi:hypothetical protein
MKKTIFAFFLSGAWIGFSEFARNELLFKSYWLEKYHSLGILFPSAPVNNALWGVWSFVLAGLTVYLTRKLKFLETAAVLWIAAFVLMWIVIGNLNVLPIKLLLFAVPLSMVEVTGAAWICSKFLPRVKRSA